MSANEKSSLAEAQDEFDLFFARGRLMLAISPRDWRFRAAAARRFPIYSFERRFFRQLMQTTIGLHVDQFWRRRGPIPESLIGKTNFAGWLQSMRETLGRQDIYPVVHGPPQLNRKRAYAHLLDAAGQPVAFAKLAFDEANNAQLERETQMLTLVQASAPQRFKTPLMITHGLFNGNRYILFEPLPISMSAVKIRWELLRQAVHEIAGVPSIIAYDAITHTDWWKHFEQLENVSPQFMRELQALSTRGLPVCRAHGDMGINNMISSGGVLWIIDWEEGSETAPLRTDEISYFLSVNQKRIMSNPRGAIVDFGKALLDTDSPEVWRDVLAALAFLAAAGRVSAQRIISNWTLSAPLPSSDQAGISQPSAVESCSHVAIISSEPADSQRQVLRRLDAELGGVKIHNIFTHSISSPAMPWQMRIEPRLNPVFFPDHHLPASRPISLRSIALYRDLKKYLQVRRVQMIILFGFDDLTRLLLIRWARRASIPLLLAGDANIFVDARTRAWNRLIKGMVVRWSLRRVFGLMPMGTCGRAFFRSYLDHRLPEFLFPCEPDYTAFAQPAPAVIEQFRAHHGLAADRKRFLYCGPLIQEKRVDLLLDAFIRTAGLCPDWDLVIAGDGPLAKQLQLMPPAALDDRIKWLGSISAENRPTLYHVCDVLVHPADCEPWGIVINEAIASNLPVITTSVVGAGVELIRHRRNGIIVTPRSVDSLANALCDMTRPDDYGEMRRWSVASLESWRKAADPVNAMRDAMRYFGLHSFPSATPTPPAEARQGELV